MLQKWQRRDKRRRQDSRIRLRNRNVPIATNDARRNKRNSVSKQRS